MTETSQLPRTAAQVAVGPVRARPITVGELPAVPAPGICLRCFRCGETFSATRSDYFMADPAEKLKHCRRNMSLGRSVTTWEEITP